MPSEDDDLIEGMLSEETSPTHQVEDLVEAVYGEYLIAHQKYCEGVPWTNKAGIVFCLVCGATIGSVNDISDAFCPKCACPNSVHLNGKCLMAGCPCSDDHEFRSTSFDTKTKEAKQWLAKKEAARQ